MVFDCPICKRPLTKETTPGYDDWNCFPSRKDHFYGIRMIKNYIDAIKIRLTDDSGSFFLRIMPNVNKSEIWTQPWQEYKIEIDHAIVPDFGNLAALKNKLQTYVLFS